MSGGGREPDPARVRKRVIVADDSVLLRDAIGAILGDAGLDVVAYCGDGQALLAQVDALRPDVAVVDVRMPPTHTDEGLVAAREIRSRWPLVGVLVLTSHPEVAQALRLSDAGSEGIGFLLKDQLTRPATFVSAVHRVTAGGSWDDPSGGS